MEEGQIILYPAGQPENPDSLRLPQGVIILDFQKKIEPFLLRPPEKSGTGSEEKKTLHQEDGPQTTGLPR
jgi:hypothetical protein